MAIRKIVLNLETVKDIKEGDVIEIMRSDGSTKRGVVYENTHMSIHLREEGNSQFGYGLISLYQGNLQYRVLKEHPPVAKYDGKYDFVHKHK